MVRRQSKFCFGILIDVFAGLAPEYTKLAVQHVRDNGVVTWGEAAAAASAAQNQVVLAHGGAGVQPGAPNTQDRAPRMFLEAPGAALLTMIAAATMNAPGHYTPTQNLAGGIHLHVHLHESNSITKYLTQMATSSGFI